MRAPTFRAGNPAGHPKGLAIAAPRLPQGGPLCAAARPCAVSAAPPRNAPDVPVEPSTDKTREVAIRRSVRDARCYLNGSHMLICSSPPFMALKSSAEHVVMSDGAQCAIRRRAWLPIW